ncbi:MAG: ABC transporter ATP-binding protein [Planctomycetes bacterium]|nr:ABC transporter ATP-binding protein [Planctomycetota bacterium]
MDDLIAIDGLGKSYGEFTAVDGLRLHVRAGELFALLGPNGAGKTTVIRMLMGVLKPSAGTATIAGHDCFADRIEVMRAVGYVPDEPVFHDYLTGRELIAFVSSMHGITQADAGARSAELVARLELRDALDEYAVNYSKGMKKKLALVLALLHQPRLLILDEPTNGLDPYATRELHQLMRERTAAGTTVFFSTHLLDQVEKLCDRVAILARGRLVAEGSLDELRSRVAADSTLEQIFFAVTGQPAGDQGAAAPNAAGDGAPR